MTPAKVPCLLAFIASCLGLMADEVRFEKIDLTASASGHCLVPVTVDGHDARFIVDKVSPVEMPFLVFTARAKVQLAEDTTFGGILGVQTALSAYGASRWALATGDEALAREVWPFIEWCLEF